MDNIDRHLLRLLQTDARASYSQLGKEVGLAVSTVTERVKRLQAAGIVREYSAHLDPESIGFGICAFVLVVVGSHEAEQNFVTRMDALHQVQECHFITGSFSYLLKVRTRSTVELQEFLQNEITALPGVTGANTMIALTTSKETTALLITEEPGTLSAVGT